MTGPTTEESSKFKRPIFLILGVVTLLNLVLLVSGYRILISENLRKSSNQVPRMIDAGGVQIDSRFLATDILECSYFTGRGIKIVTMFKSAKLDECPFVLSPDSRR
jgi:hypothetical protein